MVTIEWDRLFLFSDVRERNQTGMNCKTFCDFDEWTPCFHIWQPFWPTSPWCNWRENQGWIELSGELHTNTPVFISTKWTFLSFCDSSPNNFLNPPWPRLSLQRNRHWTNLSKLIHAMPKEKGWRFRTPLCNALAHFVYFRLWVSYERPAWQWIEMLSNCFSRSNLVKRLWHGCVSLSRGFQNDTSASVRCCLIATESTYKYRVPRVSLEIIFRA